MGRIFLGAIWERKEILELRDQVVGNLRSQGCQVFSIPDELSLTASLEWLNRRCGRGDIALNLQTEVSLIPHLHHTTVFYLAQNLERKKQAELFLLLLLRHQPQLHNRGSQPDTITEMGNLAFCRLVVIPSLVMELGFINHSQAQDILINHQINLIQGITEGLIAWSREVSGVEPHQPILPQAIALPNYPNINITLNGRNYEEQGILVNGNACLPVDLGDRLGIELTQSISLIEYQGIVYVKAIELREYNLSVNWDNLSRTVLISSILPVSRSQIEQIMGQGLTSEVQLMLFLKAHNESALNDFSEIAKLYREEGKIEGVNYDLAFCQMCLETRFLRFSNREKSAENNFAGLGSLGGNGKLADFPDCRTGVRAHIQHLKAYGSLEPLVKEVVDPRFNLVVRGIAPTVSKLSGRWSADLSYRQKIMAILRRLYEAIHLL
jgi:hypothetical protein